MITNFDYLKTESKFTSFADVTISAEKIVLMDRRLVLSIAVVLWSLL